MDNMNIRKINGFTVQLVADGVYAIDEFGIALMYLIIGKTGTAAGYRRWCRKCTCSCKGTDGSALSGSKLPPSL